MVAGGGATRTMAFGRGSRIDLRANTGNVPHLGLFVTPQHAEAMLATTVIPLNIVAFEEPVQEALSADSGIVRGEASSVLGGSVFNVSLGGKELALRKRDTVEIALDTGQLRELRLEQDGLRVSLTGSPRGSRQAPAGSSRRGQATSNGSRGQPAAGGERRLGVRAVAGGARWCKNQIPEGCGSDLFRDDRGAVHRGCERSGQRRLRERARTALSDQTVADEECLRCQTPSSLCPARCVCIVTAKS